VIDQPRLLADFPPLPGLIKQHCEDFVVEEIPLYPASGEGTHTYFLIEKRGLSTMQAVQDIARALNVRRRDIGYAGLKDARAVTRQWLSVEHVPPETVRRLELGGLRVLEATRHGNKLRLGHLAGNRFVVKVRETEAGRLGELRDALEHLCRVGVPNYFGQQRFGGRGDAWEVGRAMVRGDADLALDIMLGRPSAADRGAVLRARRLYEQGAYGAAARGWPGMFRDERRALKSLQRTGGDKRRALLAVAAPLRRFYVAAYQSHLFNCVVARRLPAGLGRLLGGDLACVHRSGSVFQVGDAALEQPRADAFEISPTGPLFGYRMSWPAGEPGRMEAQLLAAEGLERDSFRRRGLRVKGGRRALRFRPLEAKAEVGADGHGAYLELRFTLPSGCYATSLLRELFAGQSTRAKIAGSGREERS